MIPPNLRVVATLAPAVVVAACGYVPHGQWALLDADTLVLSDRSLEPCVELSRACAGCINTFRAASSRRSRMPIVRHR